MNADSRLWAAFALVGAVMIAALAAVSGWWALLWAAVPLGLGGLLVLLLRAFGLPGSPAADAGAPDFGGPHDAEPVGRPLPEEPAAPRRTHLAKSPLASAHPEYDVLLSAVVCWRADRADEPGYAGRAAALIIERAAALTSASAPQDCELTRHRLAAELGREVCAEPERIPVWAEEVRLELHDDDAARLQRLRDFRKDEEIRGYERAAERSYRRYLRDDMLADPGQAVLWWLARDPEQIHDTVNEIGTLSRLSAAANGTEIASLYRDLAGEADDTGPAPPSGTPGDAGPGDPGAPLPEIPGLLFGAGAPGRGTGDGDGYGRFPEHGDGAADAGGNPRQMADVLADLFAGTGGDEGRDRVEVAAHLLEEAGNTELARLLRAGRSPAADFPAGEEAGAEGDETAARRVEADGTDPYWSGRPTAPDRQSDSAGPTDRRGADGGSGRGGADPEPRPLYADWPTDSEESGASRWSASNGEADAADPPNGGHGAGSADSGNEGATGPDGTWPGG